MTGRAGIAAVVVLALVVASCSNGTADEAAVDDREVAVDEPEALAEDPGGSGADPEGEAEDVTPDPDAPAPSQPTPCDQGTRADIDATIGGQLAAFAADDYEGALGYASNAFRAGIDVAAFQAMIEREFTAVADASAHTIGACRSYRPDAVQAVVEVTAADLTRARMVYALVEEDGIWRISGAVIAGTPDSTLT